MLTQSAKWRRILTWIYVPILFGVAAHTGRLIYSRLTAQELRTGESIPYTVLLRETVHDPNGSVAEAVDTLRAVRSDGSVVVRYAHKKGNMTSERIVQFATGVKVTVNEQANAKSTTKEERANPASWQRDPKSKCINSFAGVPMTSQSEVISGEEMSDGYRTVKITANNITSWFALEYGCAMVKARADWGVQGFSMHNLVALTPGEPDPALFHVPEQAKEMSPSERMKNAVKDGSIRLEKCGQRCVEVFRKLDEDYYNRRAAK